ncbi:MAG: hypothetical protein EOM41_08200 [Bacilli bacterium]|nr:hypothetical protein [Bacilli bacterium]
MRDYSDFGQNNFANSDDKIFGGDFFSRDYIFDYYSGKITPASKGGSDQAYKWTTFKKNNAKSEEFSTLVFKPTNVLFSAFFNPEEGLSSISS